MKKYRLIALALVVMVALSACGGKGGDSDKSSKGTESAEKTATLSVKFFKGSEEAASEQHEMVYEGTLTAKKLADGLSNLTGLDFTIASTETGKDTITIDWSPHSSLIAGMNDQELKKGFQLNDQDSLVWFMLDSLADTVRINLHVREVYYTMNGGEELVIPNMSVTFSLDSPYMGSAFYVTDSSVQGDDPSAGTNTDTSTNADTNTYQDTENGFELVYPARFETKGTINQDTGALEFRALQGDEVLSYWVTPNSHHETAQEYYDRCASLAPNHIGWVGGDPSTERLIMGRVSNENAEEKEQGEVYWYAVTSDRIACALILCAPKDESTWYDAAATQMYIKEAN